MTRKTILIKALALALLALSGCGTIPRESPPVIFWPLPPAEPRIKYVDYIMGSRDVTGALTGLSKILLFGEEPEIRFVKPGFACTNGNTVYVTDIGRLMLFDYDKKSYIQAATDVMRNPTGLACLPDGRVIVGDSLFGTLYSISAPDYKSKRFASEAKFTSIGGMAVDAARNRIYIADTKGHRIMVTDFEGNLIKTIGRRGGEPGDFNYPYAVAVGPEGRLYVSDAGNFRIQVLDSEGGYITSFGSVGSQLGRFARPKGIAVDSEGHIYIVDSAFGNFQIFDETGLLYLSVGGAGSEPGTHLLPSGIHINTEDKIYIVDQMNRRVQIYQYIKHPDDPKPPLVQPKSKSK